MSDLRKDLIDFAQTLERHGDEDAAALVLRAGAHIAKLEERCAKADKLISDLLDEMLAQQAALKEAMRLKEQGE